MKINSTAGSYFSSDSSRFHNLTKCYSTSFLDMKKHAAFEKGATLQGLAQLVREPTYISGKCSMQGCLLQIVLCN